MDITQFLELEVTFIHGLPCVKGDYGMLLRFTHMVVQTGIEECLAFCGWIIACHFTSAYAPVEAEIAFFRKPSASAVSIDFLRALLHSSLVCVGMPRPVKGIHDAMCGDA